MSRCQPRALGAMLVAVTFVSSAHAGATPHGGDIFLGVDRGAIYTGHIESDASVTAPVYVFAAEFGDGGNPTFTSNPGFDCYLGTFPVGSRVGWNALDGIKVWNGNGFIDAPGERFTISFTAALQQIVEDNAVAGFDLAVQADGGYHRHFTFALSRSDASPPTPGVYLLNLEMYSTSPSLDPTEPFWLVFNFGDSEANHDAAIAWAQEHFVSPPACVGDLVTSDTFQPPPDGLVDGADLAVLLGAWGRNAGSPADLVDSDTFMPPPDGVVDGADLAVLLGAWGPCTP